jgi:DNA-binding CsgD family transcriptional regulator/tetratricopeptide (TPR) repeat protein
MTPEGAAGEPGLSIGGEHRQGGRRQHRAFPYTGQADLPAVIGRESELATIESFLTRVPAGPSALVIEGEAGIGKSTLWLWATARARSNGWTAITARPAEAETAHSYAALADILAPIAGATLADLPEPQRLALEQVLLLRHVAAGERIDGRAVGAAAVGAITKAAATGPLVIGIDDLTWLDSASARVIDSLTRRLGNLPVGLVVTGRVTAGAGIALGLERAVGHERVTRLELSGLSRGALQQLIHRALGLTFPRPILSRLHAASAGNAYVALEIARAIGQMPRPMRLDEQLPVPATVRALVGHRLGGLTRDVKVAMLAVAASAAPTRGDIMAVVGDEQRADRAIAGAEQAGLLVEEHGRYRAIHPLIASTIYAQSDSIQRRSVHRQLARVAAGPEDRARHLARTVAGPDETIASELETASGEARRRGAPEGAAELLRLAVELTPAGSGGLARRRMLLGTALLEIGSTAAAIVELDLALSALPGGADRATAGLQRAIAAWYVAADQQAERFALAARVEADHDPALAARIEALLAVFCADMQRASDHAAAALSLAGLPGSRLDPAVVALATWQRFLAEVYLGHPPPVELIAHDTGLDAIGDPTQVPTVPGIWALAMGRFDEARGFFADLLARSQITGAWTAAADLEARLAEVELWADRWDAALNHVDRARAAAAELEQAEPPAAMRVLATITARRGDIVSARALVAESIGDRQLADDPLVRAAWLVTATAVEMTAGDMAAAERYAAQADGALAAIGVLEPLLLDTTADRAEALVALGRTADAKGLLLALDRRCQVLPRAVNLVAAARLRALLAATDDEVEQAIEGSEPALADSAGWPLFDRLRTLLARAGLQRRRRDRRGATASLEVALQIASELRAAPWRDRAGAELDRLGRRRGAALALTPTERQVAELIAAGATNREAAAQLFMSPKTVESHLSRIYGKLGIASRAELGRRMAEIGKRPM